MSTPERRHNALTGEWVLVSPGRTQRPWLGQTEPGSVAASARYDPDCYLCPGNDRAGGRRNPDYRATFVFTNDFAALRPDVDETTSRDRLLRSETLPGTCRVVCYSPRHDLRLSLMSPAEIEAVIDTWRDQADDLTRRFRWVQIFENNGEAMGASNPHPHGQIWAGAALPTIPAREDLTQRAYMEEHGSPLLLDYAAQESGGDRIVVDGDAWMALVPYWATWPFETLLIPKTPVRRLVDLDSTLRSSLAAVMCELLVRYDNLFEHPFPYSMGWHGAPSDGGEHWQLHAHYYPPLLRSASVRKFMVGYELLSEAQRDLTPEEAAARLRDVSAVHYARRERP